MTPHDVLRRLMRGHGPGAEPGHAVLVGRHAQLYDAVAARWVLGALYRAVATEVAAAAPKDGLLLDVGTGPGRLLIELARRRPDLLLVGIDPSPDMVSRARRNVGAAGLTDRIAVCVASAEALPFADGRFDVVTSTLSAHHWADLSAGVREQARVLRAGGHLWAYDLRDAAPSLAAAVRTELGSVETEQLRAGRRLLRVLVTRHRAVRAPSDAAIPADPVR